MVAAAAVAGDARGALLMAAPAAFCLQAQELSRRVLLSQHRAGSALVSDGAGAALLLGSTAWLFVLERRDPAGPWLDAPTALLALACSALVSAVAGAWLSGIPLRATPQRLGDVLRENWAFGRWILFSRLGEGALSHGLNLSLAAFAGLQAAAGLEAARLLFAPLQVFAFGILNVTLARGAAVLADRGPDALSRYARRMVGGGAGGGLGRRRGGLAGGCARPRVRGPVCRHRARRGLGTLPRAARHPGDT
jgi:O-antigen/teichoic acid export membrane protein